MNWRKLLYSRQFKKLKKECRAHGIRIEAVWSGSDVELRGGRHRLKYNFTPFCRDPFRRALEQWFDGRADPYTLPLSCADIALVLSLPAEAVYTSRDLRYCGKKYISLTYSPFTPSETQEIIRRISRGISGIEKRLSAMTNGDNYICLRPYKGGGVSSRMTFLGPECDSYETCYGYTLREVCEAAERFLRDRGFLADDYPLLKGKLMDPSPEIFRWENEKEPITRALVMSENASYLKEFERALRAIPGDIQYHHAPPNPSSPKLDKNRYFARGGRPLAPKSVLTGPSDEAIESRRMAMLRPTNGEGNPYVANINIFKKGLKSALASTPRTENKLGGLEVAPDGFLSFGDRLMRQFVFPEFPPADMASEYRFKSYALQVGESIKGRCLRKWLESRPDYTGPMHKGPVQRETLIENWSNSVIFTSSNSVPEWD